MSMHASLARPSLSQIHICRQCLLRSQRQRSRHPQLPLPIKTRLFATSTRENATPPPIKKGALALLEERGYINQLAGDRDLLSRLLDSQRVGFYAGVDPTAPSLHLGHLLPFMVLFWLYLHGHETVSLVGGATARIGDPSGRLTSRTRTVEDSYSEDYVRMDAQLGRIWDGLKGCGEKYGFQGRGEFRVMTNAAWLDGLNVLDFLRVMGNSMRVGTMLGRDTVRNKLEKGDGMSFSEFTYPLLQAWDWWHLYRSSNVMVQIGGGDQYGNIVAGMDAIKTISTSQLSTTKTSPAQPPMGLTVPLLTTSSGEKFGKSAGNAIWLDKTLTPTFDLYGFLLKTSDQDIARYLKLFTFLPLPTIASAMQNHAANPGAREPQHLLAREVLELVHGREEALAAERAHRGSRRPSLDAFSSPADGESGLEGQERVSLPREQVVGLSMAAVLQVAVPGSSKSGLARMISSGGLYVARAQRGSAGEEKGELDFVAWRDPRGVVGEEALVGEGKLLVLRLGKWKVRVVEVV
ncbi:hypothetical protein MBLNU230_g2389t1 [Neophaeotheca triangularis]